VALFPLKREEERVHKHYFLNSVYYSKYYQQKRRKTMENKQIMELATIKNGELIYDFTLFKKQATELSSTYSNMVYPENVDDAIKQMKSDRAYLNKILEQIDTSRISIKKLFMEPYNIFEADCKELQKEISIPLKQIDTSIKNIEVERKKRKKAEIISFFNEVAAEIEDEYREIFLSKIFNEKWLNTNTSKKAYQDSIRNSILLYVSGKETIFSSGEPDFQEEAFSLFKSNLNLAEAVAFINRRKQQRDEILRREKERLEQEALIKARAELSNQKRNTEENIPGCYGSNNMDQQQNSMHFSNITPNPESPDVRENKKNTIFIRFSDGMVTGVYANTDAEVVLLDEDTASDQEILEFEKNIQTSIEIY